MEVNIILVLGGFFFMILFYKYVKVLFSNMGAKRKVSIYENIFNPVVTSKQKERSQRVEQDERRKKESSTVFILLFFMLLGVYLIGTGKLENSSIDYQKKISVEQPTNTSI